MNSFMNYDFNISKIVVSCFVPKGTGASTHVNRPSHGLAFATEGENQYIFSDGKILTIKANEVIYLPKSSTYKIKAIAKGSFYAINFDFNDTTFFSPFVLKIKNHTEVLEIFRRVNKAWLCKNIGFTTKCKADLYNIIYNIQKSYFSDYFPKNKFNIIEPAIKYIHTNYTRENISVTFLSNLCNITPEYFRIVFRGFFGNSPTQYINSLKITRAKELLETKSYTVSDVCFLSGFHDESYFSREFKKATGVSPSKYMN